MLTTEQRENAIRQHRTNLDRIELIAVAGPLLAAGPARMRVMRLVDNLRHSRGTPPLAVLFVGNETECADARDFEQDTVGAARCLTVYQECLSGLVGTTIEVFRQEIDATATAFDAKRRMRVLTRRGGRGQPHFVAPFVAGAGTTCGEWTRPVGWTPDGKPIKGFIKASVATGLCPVECRYCYLHGYATEAMEVALNLEDLGTELLKDWRGHPHPINFGETGGLVEMDEWFAGPEGEGSLVQTVIDSCVPANITPFFLSKVAYPRYLRFHGKVQVGISLMPEPVRTWLAPFGSSSIELLDSLAWAATHGAADPVVRLTMLWNERAHYPELLAVCRDRLGTADWRLTLDILRFTPGTAIRIAKRYPDAADKFARELSPETSASLVQLAHDGHGAKKIRPLEDRQAEIYSWVREQLNHLGCGDIMITPCKGNPTELLPLVKEGVIKAMPCACYAANSASCARGCK